LKTKYLYERADRVLEVLNFAFSRIAGFLIVFCMATITIDVIGRYFFGKPVIWVYYYSEYVLVYSTFLAAAYVLKHNGHVRVDLVVNLLNQRHRAFLSVFTSLIGLLACAVVGWYSLMEACDVLQAKTMFTAPISMYQFPIKVIIPFGCLMLCVEWLRKLFTTLLYLIDEDASYE